MNNDNITARNLLTRDNVLKEMCSDLYKAIVFNRGANTECDKTQIDYINTVITLYNLGYRKITKSNN